MKIMSFLALLMASTLSSMAQQVIDVHCHIIPQAYISFIDKHNALMEEGFPLPKWDVDKHLKWMDETGIKTSVLTLAAPQPYYGDTKESQKIIRQLNEEAANAKKKHPGRFLWCATLPLPDVKAAIAEAKYALDTLHADGIKLATNARGQYLGAPELDTLMAFLSSRKAVVVLHPHRPTPVNEQVMAQTPLAMQEYLSETTRAVSNMISRNVLARYAGISVIVPHCGAYLPISLTRMKSLIPLMQQNHLVGHIDWEQNLKALYYDLAGSHSPEAIRRLLTITTPNHILYGSDYPYGSPQMLTQSIERMRDYLSKEPDLKPYKDMFLWKNAQALFGKRDN